MAVQTIYLLGTTAVTPNWWGNTQLNGSVPGAANSAYGWAPAKVAVTTPYTRGRLGATAASTDVAIAASYNAATSGPAKGTGSGATTAGDSFIAGPFSGKFAATAWTFNFNLRASVAGAVGHINLRVWRSRNADGSVATQLLANTVGVTVTLSTTVDTNSSVSWSPGAVSLDNEYLFLQVEWQETIAGTSNTDNILFRIGTALVTTPDFVAAALATGTPAAAASALAASGLSAVSGTSAPIAQSGAVVGTAVSSSSGSGGLPAGVSTVASVGDVQWPSGFQSLLAVWLGGAGLPTLGSSGTGALVASGSVLSGTGTSGLTGTGALAASTSALAGSGLVSSAGTGVLVASGSALVSSGLSSSSGTGALTTTASTLAGLSPIDYSGTGALAAAESTLVGTGLSRSLSTTGALVDASSALLSTGLSRSLSTGALLAAASTLVSAGLSSSSGTGALVASSSMLNGYDELPSFSGAVLMRRISMPLGTGV